MSNYSISGWAKNDAGELTCVTIQSAAVVAEFGRRGLNVPASLTEILTHGIRYSNQDFDVLSNAMHILEVGDLSVWTRIASN